MDNTYVSKDNGLTWTKRVGNSLTRSVYGGKFVDVGTSLSLITKRNQRTDGSSISPDVITIGQEGATTVIGGRASILQGLTLGSGDTSNHLTFSRNGQFTMGIGSEANPTLIMGAATNTVSIPGLATLSGGLSVTGNINLGSEASVTIDHTLKVANISGYTTDTTLRIGTTLTTGSIQMGNSQTTGSISLGSSASAVNIPGNIKCNTIEPDAITSDQMIASTQTSGRLILGDLVGRTGNIFIGNRQGAISGGGSDGGIYIGTNATSNLVTVNIGSSSNVIHLKGKIIVNNEEYNTNVYAFNVKSTSTFNQGIAQLAFLDTNWSYISCNKNGTFRGGIQGINDSSIFFASSSDRRLKKNIKPMKPMLDTIMLMKPCEHGWLTNDDTAYGFIAQEVHQLFPEMRHGVRGCADLDEPCDCETGKPIYYSLDYGRFTPYIVKAVQEMKLDYDTKLQSLKTDYDAKISTLESRLLALEQKTSV